MTLRAKSILIVEDSETMRSFFAHAAKQLGFETIASVSSVEQALRLDLSQTDVVLADWSLGEIDGIEFTRRIRKGEARVPANAVVVLVTGHADMKVIEQAREAGIDSILVKPVSVRQLEQKIQKALAAPRGIAAPQQDLPPAAAG